MRKYKLLKELPWLEVWTIIEYKDGIIYYLDTIHFEEIGDMIKDIIENKWIEWWLEEIKPKSIYELKKWDTYYSINNFNRVEKVIITHSSYYENDLEYWNVFLTNQEAKQELRKRKALAAIKKWIWEKKVKKILELDAWYVIKYNQVSWYKIILTDDFSRWDIIFFSREDAEKCLQECKQEWEILFG